MASIPTGIPKSLIRNVKRLLSGGVLDVIWKLFVSALFLTIAYVLIAASPGLGAIIAGIVIVSLVSDEIRALIGDVWHRNFWVWRV